MYSENSSTTYSGTGGMQDSAKTLSSAESKGNNGLRPRRAAAAGGLKSNRELPVPRGAAAGFTLIEILISIAIFSIIFSFIFGVMTTTLDTGKSVEEKMDLDQVGRFIIKRMTHDLTSATTLPLSRRGRFVGNSAAYEGFSMDEVHFTAFTRLYFGNRPRIDQSEIGYYFKFKDGESAQFMRRESDAIKDQVETGGTAFEVTTSIKELKIRYLGNKSYQGWVENWNSEDPATLGFPRAVSIELLLFDGKRENFYSTVVVLEEYGKV